MACGVIGLSNARLAWTRLTVIHVPASPSTFLSATIPTTTLMTTTH